MGLKRWIKQWQAHLRPDFFILGAQKAGTTSLHYYLSQHPNIHMARGKETDYFALQYHRSERWYLNHFPTMQDVRRSPQPTAVGEASPNYLFYPQVPARLHAHLPHVKFIVLLRDPVERAISHYFMAVRNGRELLPIEDAFASEMEPFFDDFDRLTTDRIYLTEVSQRRSYCARGMYREQLDNWLRFFPLDRFLFIRTDIFAQHPPSAVGTVCSFLGVPEVLVHDYQPINTGEYGAVDLQFVEKLRQRFRKSNYRLAELLGPAFDFNELPALTANAYANSER